jgi:hypothetical protein
MNKMAGMNDKDTFSFIQTYSLNKGLKKFGDHGKEAAQKEMKQLHDHVVFEPILIADMTPLERKRAMETSFLLPKRVTVQSKHKCAQTEALNASAFQEKRQPAQQQQQKLSSLQE